MIFGTLSILNEFFLWRENVNPYELDNQPTSWSHFESDSRKIDERVANHEERYLVRMSTLTKLDSEILYYSVCNLNIIADVVDIIAPACGPSYYDAHPQVVNV